MVPDVGSTINDPVSFGLVSTLPSIYNNIKADGVFGLALHSSRSSEKMESTIFEYFTTTNENMFAPVITIYYSYIVKTPKLSIGQDDIFNCFENHFSERVEIIKNRNWAFSIDAFFYSTQKAFTKQVATIDYTSDYIFVPKNVYDSLLKNSNITEDPIIKKLYTTCDHNLSIDIYPNGAQDIHISSRFLSEDIGKGRCVYNIRKSLEPFENEWKLGLPFLRQTCTTLDFRGYLQFSKVKGKI